MEEHGLIHFPEEAAVSHALLPIDPPGQTIRTDDLDQYREAGYDLIPLHRWNYRDLRDRERGKSPRDPLWRRRDG